MRREEQQEMSINDSMLMIKKQVRMQQKYSVSPAVQYLREEMRA